MAKRRSDTPPARACDVEAYAAQLAAAAPPLTADQLDVLGQIVRSAPVTPETNPVQQRRRARRSRAMQLTLPYHQVDAQPAGVTGPGSKIAGRKRVGDVEERPISEPR